MTSSDKRQTIKEEAIESIDLHDTNFILLHPKRPRKVAAHPSSIIHPESTPKNFRHDFEMCINEKDEIFSFD